jgi:hypothetical protein
MEINYDIFSAITRFLDIKDIESLATSSSTNNAFRKNTISADSKLLSIYLNNVIKNCSTKDEVAQHLDRFESGCVTPFDLTCNNTETDKLIPIKEKFQNLRSLTYIRPETLPSLSLTERIGYYVFTTFFKAISRVILSLSNCQLVRRYLLGNDTNFSRFITKPLDKLLFRYERIEAALTKEESSIELAASLYPKMEKLNVRLIKDSGSSSNAFCTLPALQNLQSLSITSMTPNDSPIYLRTTGPLFDQYSSLKTLTLGAVVIKSLSANNNAKEFPKQLKEISVQACDEGPMKYLLSTCDSLESLSYIKGNTFSEGPLPRPYESLKKFKCGEYRINMQNLFLSFPNLEELEVPSNCVPDAMSRSEKIKKITTTSLRNRNLTPLLEQYPNLENLIFTYCSIWEFPHDMPRQFKVESRIVKEERGLLPFTYYYI